MFHGKEKRVAAVVACVAFIVAECITIYLGIAPAHSAGDGSLIYEESYRVGVLPYPSKAATTKSWNNIVSELNRHSAIKYEPYFANNYSEILEGFVNNRFDLAVLDPAMVGPCLSNNPDLTLFLLCSMLGDTSDNRAILATRNSSIMSISQTKGMRIAFVDPHSLLGYVVQNAFLSKKFAGFRDDAWFSKMYFASSAAQAAADLMSGAADIIAVSKDALAYCAKSYAFDDKDVNSAWVSQMDLPGHVLCLNQKSFRRGDTSELRNRLLRIASHGAQGSGTSFSIIDKPTYLYSLSALDPSLSPTRVQPASAD